MVKIFIGSAVASVVLTIMNATGNGVDQASEGLSGVVGQLLGYAVFSSF